METSLEMGLLITGCKGTRGTGRPAWGCAFPTTFGESFSPIELLWDSFRGVMNLDELLSDEEGDVEREFAASWLRWTEWKRRLASLSPWSPLMGLSLGAGPDLGPSGSGKLRPSSTSSPAAKRPTFSHR